MIKKYGSIPALLSSCWLDCSQAHAINPLYGTKLESPCCFKTVWKSVLLAQLLEISPGRGSNDGFIAR